MNDQLAGAIAVLNEQLEEQLRGVQETKRLINQLSKKNGEEPPYPDADSEITAGMMKFRRDQFYGQPLATAIREILEMRRSAGRGPATVQEIYEALLAGGFAFNTKNAENAKRGIYISLGKNTQTFHRLPGGSDESAVFGMLAWYPGAKPAKSESKTSDSPKAQDQNGGSDD